MQYNKSNGLGCSSDTTDATFNVLNLSTCMDIQTMVLVLVGGI